MKLVEIVLVHKFSRPNDFTHKGINYFYLNRHSKNISRYLVKYGFRHNTCMHVSKIIAYANNGKFDFIQNS